MDKEIDKETFRKTEKLLYNYFEQPKQIEGMQNHIALLKKQIEVLEQRIKENDVVLSTGSNMGIDYSAPRVQTSFSGSYAEKELCRQIQELEERKTRKNDRINKLIDEIQNIQETNQIIHDNIKMLSEEKKKIIELKYEDKLYTDEILDKLNISRALWFKKRKKLIENIAQWFRVLRV